MPWKAFRCFLALSLQFPSYQGSSQPSRKEVDQREAADSVQQKQRSGVSAWEREEGMVGRRHTMLLLRVILGVLGFSSRKGEKQSGNRMSQVPEKR